MHTAEGQSTGSKLGSIGGCSYDYCFVETRKGRMASNGES
jgi:hypothetical protein